MRTSLNYNRLHYFHMVATLGSQAAASRELGVGQSTISEQLKLLEADLGTKLFDRGPGGLRLTETGRRVLQHTDVIFGAGHRLMQELTHDPTDKQPLEIGVSSTVSRSFATEFFMPLFERDRVLPRIRHGDHLTLVQQLMANELDILLSDVEPNGKLGGRVRIHVAAQPALILAASPTLAERFTDFPNGLDGKPFLHLTRNCNLRPDIDGWLRERNITVDTVSETEDMDLVRMAACRGYGFCILPRRFVSPDLEQGRLVELGELEIRATVYLTHVEHNPTDTVKVATELLTQFSRAEEN